MITHNIADILSSFNGTTFAAIDTITDVKVLKTLSAIKKKPISEEDRVCISILELAGVKENPFHGIVFKKTIGSKVQLFQNKNSNGYENMVKRRLEKEGKNPEDFVLSPAKWGERIKDTPIISHNGEFYLEVIFQYPGTSSYITIKNGVVEDVEKSDILGLPEPREFNGQGGLEDQVCIRRFKLSSLQAIRMNHKEYSGTFVYNQ